MFSMPTNENFTYAKKNFICLHAGKTFRYLACDIRLDIQIDVRIDIRTLIPSYKKTIKDIKKIFRSGKLCLILSVDSYILLEWNVPWYKYR